MNCGIRYDNNFFTFNALHQALECAIGALKSGKRCRGQNAPSG